MGLFGKKNTTKEAEVSVLPDDIKKIKSAIERVWNSSEYNQRRENMSRWLKEYQGDWWAQDYTYNKRDPKNSLVFANLIFSHIQNNAPLLTDNRPTWYVRARESYMQNYINIYSKVLEYLWDKEELDHKIYLAVKDALLFPIGLIKVYFDETKGDFGELSFDLVDPREFVCAPGVEDIWEAPWEGEKCRKPLSWIKETYPEKYDSVHSDPGDQDDARKWPGAEEDFVTVYEIWLRDNEIEEYIEEQEDEAGNKTKTTKKKPKYPYGRIVTFTENVLLNDRPSPFKHGKPSYVSFYDYEPVHGVFGMPEAAQIENINRELNARLQALVWSADKHHRTNYTLDADSGLDPEKVKTEMPNGDNVWVVNRTVDGNPLRAVEEPPVSVVHNKLIEILLALDEEVSGLTAVSKGQAVKKQRQSASEMSILIESSYTRTRQRVRNLEWSIKRLAYLALSLMQQFYSEPRSFNYREDENINYGMVSNSPAMLKQTLEPESDDYMRALEYLEKNPDKVYADFEIEIQTNSTLPMDRQSLANLAMRLYEIKAIDREALFEVLNYPKGKEIAGRIAQQEQAMMAARAGPQGNPQGPPGTPVTPPMPGAPGQMLGVPGGR